jgi:hypothetical protein
VDADLKALAGRFLAFVEDAAGLPMIVCDESGTIVHCRTAARLGVVHDSARRIVLGEADELFVTAAQAAADPRMKEGCNVLLAAEGFRLGTFGIAGPLALAQPLARVAAAVFASWLKEQRQQAALTRAADSVFEGVRQVSARTERVAVETRQVVEVMTAASRDAAEKVADSGKITQTVQAIAKKTRILSLNGSMEASRAGTSGRAFSVVARETLELSQGAHAAAQQIEERLGEVQSAIATVSTAIDRSAALATDQATALAEVMDVVGGLQRAVQALAHSQAPPPPSS